MNRSKSLLTKSNFKSTAIELYGENETTLDQQFKRYQAAIQRFKEFFPASGIHLFSTPGRTEIGGNHTDHNAGMVLAAAVNLDSIAAVQPISETIVTVRSKGYDQPFVVNLDDLRPCESEVGTTTALIRGIASRFHESGYRIGGFNAYIDSYVMVGSGLSSSASIEILIGQIFGTLYNAGHIPKEELAKIGQYAENMYFGKPCGLMDQITCAIGGIVSIDFRSADSPKIQKVEFDFSTQKYSLLVIDTGGNHANLTDDYASIPAEMKAVAKELGGNVCRDLSIQQLLPKIKTLRSKIGDRAILRAIHFLSDSQRVGEQVTALENGDFNSFLGLVSESGNSSFKWLQNCYTTKSIKSQGIPLALALTENYFQNNIKGACRVHGGGFAGTIQVFIPTDEVPEYLILMESVFGENSVNVLSIRQTGTAYFGFWGDIS